MKYFQRLFTYYSISNSKKTYGFCFIDYIAENLIDGYPYGNKMYGKRRIRSFDIKFEYTNTHTHTSTNLFLNIFN